MRKVLAILLVLGVGVLIATEWQRCLSALALLALFAFVIAVWSKSEERFRREEERIRRESYGALFRRPYRHIKERPPMYDKEFYVYREDDPFPF